MHAARRISKPRRQSARDMREGGLRARRFDLLRRLHLPLLMKLRRTACKHCNFYLREIFRIFFPPMSAWISLKMWDRDSWHLDQCISGGVPASPWLPWLHEGLHRWGGFLVSFSWSFSWSSSLRVPMDPPASVAHFEAHTAGLGSSFVPSVIQPARVCSKVIHRKHREKNYL